MNPPLQSVRKAIRSTQNKEISLVWCPRNNLHKYHSDFCASPRRVMSPGSKGPGDMDQRRLAQKALGPAGKAAQGGWEGCLSHLYKEFLGHHTNPHNSQNSSREGKGSGRTWARRGFAGEAGLAPRKVANPAMAVYGRAFSLYEVEPGRSGRKVMAATKHGHISNVQIRKVSRYSRII